ncbi:MAG TPA: hypothetical protein PLR18_00350 [bacterium]|nr:hypothetical protein [bacterium]
MRTKIFLIILLALFAVASAKDPANTVKFNVATSGGKNSVSAIVFHLRERSGFWAIIPQSGIQAGVGPNIWINGHGVKGCLFNPLTLCSVEDSDGIEAGEVRLWNIFLASSGSLKVSSLSYYSWPLVESKTKSFYTKDQITFCNFGLRIESTWLKDWSNLVGPIYQFNLHPKLNLLFFLNLNKEVKEKRSLRMEMTVNF